MIVEKFDNSGGSYSCLIKCPVCGQNLNDPDIRKWKHFYNEHTPEDFGLSPMGERND